MPKGSETGFQRRRSQAGRKAIKQAEASKGRTLTPAEKQRAREAGRDRRLVKILDRAHKTGFAPKLTPRRVREGLSASGSGADVRFTNRKPRNHPPPKVIK